MKLNCDLGEGFPEVDAHVMPHIDMANIACGGHTGDQTSMQIAVELANKHHVHIGAHPSYPDRAHFGRKPFAISSPDLHINLYQQIQNLRLICESQKTALAYIKPHGQLYHDCIYNKEIRIILLDIAQDFQLPLMLMATPENHTISEHAKEFNVTVIFEVFADRSYDNNGHLVARSQSHAIHTDIATIQKQARSFIEKNGTYSDKGRWLNICAESICVHGDTPLAMEAIHAIRALFTLDTIHTDTIHPNTRHSNP